MRSKTQCVRSGYTELLFTRYIEMFGTMDRYRTLLLHATVCTHSNQVALWPWWFMTSKTSRFTIILSHHCSLFLCRNDVLFRLQWASLRARSYRHSDLRSGHGSSLCIILIVLKVKVLDIVSDIVPRRRGFRSII